MKNKYLPIFLALVFSFTSGLVSAQSAKELMKGAKAQMELSQYKEAENLLNKCIDSNQGTAATFELRAKCREKLLNFPEAAADYEKALQSEPGNADYLAGAANAHFEAANYKKAAEYFSQLAGLKKNNGEIFAQKARAELYQKNFKRAIDDASISITEKSSYLGYWVRAIAQDSLGKPDLAAMDHALATENLKKSKAFKESNHKSEFIPYFQSAALCELERKKFDGALLYLNQALEWSANDPDLIWLKGKALAGKDNHSAAMNEYNKAIAISDKKDYYFVSRAEVFLAQGQDLDALSDYSRAITLNNRNEKALYHRAMLNKKIQKLAEARTDIEKALALQPNNQEYKNSAEEIKKLIIEKNKELNKPQVSLIKPFITKDKKAVMGAEAKSLMVKGKVLDESKIESILVNDQAVKFDKGNLNPEFSIEIKTELVQTLNVSVTDIYGNNTTLVYGILRAETEAPIVELLTPTLLGNDAVAIGSVSNVKFYIEGLIRDKSLIDNIVVNNVSATFSPTKINPEFNLTCDLTGFDSLKIEVTDVFGNKSLTRYYINRSAEAAEQSNPMGKTWLVFIENSNYNLLPSLEAVSGDVALVKKAMSNYKIDSILTRKNLSKAQMEKFFSIELRDLLAKNNVNSLMIWYSGHGKATTENGYWLPVDASKKDEFTYFPTSSLKGFLSAYKKVKHTLVIADATETGPSFYLAMRDVNPWQCGDWQATKLKSAQVLASAEAERLNESSTFSKAFANALSTSPDKCITIEKVSEKVISTVQKNQRQKPRFGNIQDLGDENGTFFFIKK